MISIIKYFSEAEVGIDIPWLDDQKTFKAAQQGPITGAIKAATGIRSRADVIEAQRQKDYEHGLNLKMKMAQKDKMLHDWEAHDKTHGAHDAAGNTIKKAADKAKDVEDITGSEAAGHAMKKGAESAGEAVGSVGQKVGELAGEHPGLVAGAVGIGAGLLLARRKKAQAQQ